jgi:hypothetical protein
MQWTTDELLAAVKGKPSPSAFRQFMDDLRSPKNKRSYLFPVSRNQETKSLEPALPGFMLDMLEAAAAPGEVYRNPALMINPETGRTSDYAIGRSADLAGMMTLGSGAIPADKNSLRMGIKAYHGSPHDFDRFSMDKIGTGEGAQAYGHGLYFAENEGVARNYRDALSPAKVWNIPPNKIAPELADFGFDPKALDLARETLSKLNGDGFQAVSALDGVAANTGNKTAKEAASVIRSFHRNVQQGGRMYEVNIDANPDDFLDWDRPLSEQSPAVQKVAQDYYQDISQQTGSDLVSQYRYMGNAVEGDLKKAGVPGVKYLDAGSRGAGDGSRNYVVFDDKLISIVKKYGVAALVSAGVLSQSDAEALAAQGYK